MKLYIADAFTDHLFGGNPAGVVILDDGGDFPDDQICVQTAAELRYSETVFIKKNPLREGSQERFHLRYFTPEKEVELCGHATIAAFSVMSRFGIIENEGDFTIMTLAGDLTVNVRNGFIMMEMGAPEYLGTLTEAPEIAELYRTMGLSFEDVIPAVDCCQHARLLPSIVSTGLPDIIMPVASLAELDSIAPDFSALAELSKRYGVIGVHAFTLQNSVNEEGVRAHTRNFAPLVGINEEAATGTSNGALTYYLHINGLIDDNSESLFVQGEAMGRPSKVYSHIRKSEGGKLSIRIGGTGVTLAAGEIYI